MHHRKAYNSMYINFQQNMVGRAIKTVHTNLLAKQRKWQKFATCNSNFEKSRLMDMHYPITDIQANFGINRPIGYQITAKKKIIYTNGRADRRTDGRQDRQTDGQTLRMTTIDSFSKKEKKY